MPPSSSTRSTSTRRHGAVARLLDDPAHAAELVRRGHERARAFTWEAGAEAVLATYETGARGTALTRLGGSWLPNPH